MKRTSLVSGIILPALLAIVPACSDPPPCDFAQLQCGQSCIDPMADANNCGTCGNVCAQGSSCADGSCHADATCTLPEVSCSGLCVDTTTSEAHCGSCDIACGPFGECLASSCAEPLALLQTSLQDRTTDRDLFALQDHTFALTKLNTSTFATSRVLDHAILPDGSVLLVAAETEGVFELFRVSPRGGALTRVSGPLVANGDVLPGLVISADGRVVLYRADAEVDGEIDLYAAALAAPGTAVKVNGALVAGGGVSRVFAISATGTRVAYIADADTDGLDEAYTVDLSTGTPSAPVKLNPPLAGSVWDLKMSSTGARVLYRIQDNGTIPLYLVEAATPGVATRVTYADDATGHVNSYKFTDDDAAVVFNGGSQYLGESLWRAPLAPLAAATLLADGTNQTWVSDDFIVTHDGARVYFRKVLGGFSLDRVFRVDVATPGVLTLLSTDTATSVDDVTDFALSADEHAVVFRGGADGAEGGNSTPGTADPGNVDYHAPALFRVDVTAATPAPVLLSPAPIVGRDGIGNGYVLSRDGTRVIYRADGEVLGNSDAYLVEVATAGTARKVSPPLDTASDSTDVSLLSRF
jgi:Tol biopolymer transport system component